MLHALVLASILNGTVVLHHRTGAEDPVPAALVDLRNGDQVLLATAMTATDGTFTLPDLAPGQYWIHIISNSSGGGGTVTVPIGVPAETRTFYLFEPTCGAIYGRVRDLTNGLPVGGAEVFYLGGSITNENGDYFINFGCYSGPGFRFHNSFYYGVRAEGYKTIDIFGGRAEYVSGSGGGIHDFDLWPLHPLREPAPVRPPALH